MNEKEKEKVPSRRGLRRAAWTVAIVLGLLLIVLAVVPGLLSTDSGRDWLFDKASEAIPGGLDAEGIDLNWSGGQKVKELRLRDASGNQVARVRNLHATYSLLQLAGGDYGDGRVLIEGLELDLLLDESGGLNLAAAVAATGKDSEPTDARKLLRELVVELPPSLKLTVELRDASISLGGPGFDKPFRLTQVNGTLTASGAGSPVQLDLKGIVGRASEASLALELAGFDKHGRLQASKAQLQMALAASWEEGDAAGRTVTALRALLGATTKLNLELSTAQNSVTIATTTSSPLLEVKGGATLDLTAPDRAALRVAEPVSVHYRVTPASLREFATGDAEVELEREFDVDLQLDSLQWMTGSREIEAAARFTVGDGTLKVRVGDRDESLAWTGWAARFNAGGPQGGLQANLTGRLLDGQVELTAEGTSADSAQLRATVRKLPLAAIDRVAEGFTGRAGVLVDWLGPELNLEATVASTDADTASADVAVKTQRLDLVLPLAIDRKNATISGSQAAIQYALAPGLVPGIANEKDLAILLRADSFRLPLGAFDANLAALNATLKVGRATLAGATPVVLEGFECRVASDSLAQSVAIEANGKIDTGTLKVAGKLERLWDEAGRFGLDRALGTLDVVVTGFPIGRIEAALGERIDANIQVQASGTEARIDVDCRSDLLTVRLPLRVADRRAQLTEAGSVRYRVTPELAGRFSSIELERAFDLEIALASMSIPLVASPDLEDAAVVARLKLGTVALANIYQGRSATLSDTVLTIGGENLAKARATLAGAIALDGVDLGGPLLVGAAGNRDGGTMTLSSGRVALEAEVARRDDAYALVRPAKASVRVDPALLTALKVRSDWLNGPLTIQANLASLSVPRDLDLARVAADLNLMFGAASLRAGEQFVALHSAGLGIQTRGRDLAFDLAARVGDGTVKATGSAREWLADGRPNRNAAIECRAEVRSLPTGLLDARLESLIGDTIAIDAGADLPGGVEDPRGVVKLDVRAPRFTTNMHLRSDDGFELAGPARLTWTLTPAALRTLLPESELRLGEAAQFSATVDKFRRNTDGGLIVGGKAVVPLFALIDGQGNATTVRNLQLSADLPAVGRPLTVQLDGAMEGGAKPGRLAGTLTIQNAAQVRALDQLSVRGTVSFSNVATAPIDGLLDLDGYLPAVLGADASAALTLQLVEGLGPVDLNLTSGNLKANIAAQVTRDAYRLREPILAELQHSRLLADKVLPKLGPFFQGIAATERPISFRVDREGFGVPREFDFSKVSVPRAVMDLGKVTLKNKMLVQLVKQLARSSVQDQTTAWFTPVEIRLDAGVVRYSKRLDLLFDRSVHLSTWGSADLGRNRLDMTIGIMPETLNRVLGIKRAGASDTLRVPVRGTLDEPKLDLGSTLRDVAAIRAKEEAVQRLPGIAGKIAEGALDALLKTSFSGAPPVPAAVDPLPWVDPRKQR